MTTRQPDLTEGEVERLRDLATKLRGVRKQSEHLFLGLPLCSFLDWFGPITPNRR